MVDEVKYGNKRMEDENDLLSSFGCQDDPESG
jgi:hypothetical protein